MLGGVGEPASSILSESVKGEGEEEFILFYFKDLIISIFYEALVISIFRGGFRF